MRLASTPKTSGDLGVRGFVPKSTTTYLFTFGFRGQSLKGAWSLCFLVGNIAVFVMVEKP